MIEGSPRLELIERTESTMLAGLGNLIVHVHDRQIGTAAMRRFAGTIDEVLEREPEGVCLLWVSLTRQTNPDERAMRERVELVRHPGERLLGLAFVTERGGLASTMKRNAARHVREQLGELAPRMGIFQDLREGVEFLGAAVVPAVGVGELVGQVERLWGG